MVRLNQISINRSNLIKVDQKCLSNLGNSNNNNAINKLQRIRRNKEKNL